MRTLAIGDIHSGVRALEQVMERAAVTEQDHLIFLGDYVDGWSTATETIAFLIALQKSHQCTFIRNVILCTKFQKDAMSRPENYINCPILG